MKGKWFLTGILVLTALLALAAGLSLAQGPEPQGGSVEPQGDVGIADTVYNRIPIQGRLTDASGNPLNGTYTIDFYLYDSPTGGNLICSDTVNNNVPVNNGLFNWEIWGNCLPGTITGQQLYLELRVEGETLSPRQPIYPVPYAWSLMPGAIIEDQAETLLKVHNTAISGLSHGVYSLVDSDSGVAVYGEARSGGGSTYGVYGASASTSGTGVQGLATATTGTTWGVYGWAVSSDGYGGYFTNPNGTALKAGGSGIIQSTAVSRIFIPGTEAVRHADSRNDLELEYYGRGTVVVRKVTSGAGTETLLVPVVIPAVLYGQPVRIHDMRVFYSVSNSSSYIDETHLYRQKMDGGYYELIADTTDRNSTTFTYYHIYCTAAECRLDTEEGIISVALHLHFADPGHTFTIGGIRLTLEHD